MRINPVKSLIILALAALLSACGSSPTAPEHQAGKAVTTGKSNIAGTWEGVMPHGASALYLRLELSPGRHADGKTLYEGSAHVQPIEGYRRKLPVTAGQQGGTAAARVVHDPRLNTFSIQLTGQPRPHGTVLLFNGLEGMYDPRGQALAGLYRPNARHNPGVSGGGQYFVLVRPKPFQRLDDALERRKSLLSISFTPSKSKLREWAKPFDDANYAGPDQRQLQSRGWVYGTHEHIAIKLFRDDHFKKYFGAPFDELSGGNLASIEKDLRGEPLNGLARFRRMFQTGQLDNAAVRTTIMVNAQRHLLNWRQDRLAELKRLPAEKGSLAHTDSVEQALAGIAPFLLWPQEMTADTQQIAAVRAGIAYPTLKTMLARFESATPDLALMRQLAGWERDEQRLFSYLDATQRRTLVDAANKRLDSVLAQLLPRHQQRIATLGEGLPGLLDGNGWYREFSTDFAPVMQHPRVTQVRTAFEQRRGQQLAQAEADMLMRVQADHATLPTAMSQQADTQRLNYCKTLKQYEQTWFVVPSDTQHATTRSVKTRMAQLGGQATSLLPPRLRNTGFPPVTLPDNDRAQRDFHRSRVHREIARRGALADNDNLVRQILPKPIRDAGFEFTSDITWALFHGRFDQLDARHYQGQGLGTDLFRQMGIHPRFHYAFITYAGLSHLKHGTNQIGPATEVYWYDTNLRTGEIVRSKYGEIHLAEVFRPYYEHSHKVAASISKTDALFGQNGIGILQTFLDFGTGNIFSKVERRPDGQMALSGGAWEKAVQHDLGQLLNQWPQQSYGLWQLQENIVRYLKGRPSLQSLYGYES